MTTSDVLPSDPVSAESARSFADNFLAAWNSHDPERLVALSDPTVRWRIRTSRAAGSAATTRSATGWPASGGPCPT